MIILIVIYYFWLNLNLKKQNKPILKIKSILNLILSKMSAKFEIPEILIFNQLENFYHL